MRSSKYRMFTAALAAAIFMSSIPVTAAAVPEETSDEVLMTEEQNEESEADEINEDAGEASEEPVIEEDAGSTEGEPSPEEESADTDEVIEDEENSDAENDSADEMIPQEQEDGSPDEISDEAADDLSDEKVTADEITVDGKDPKAAVSARSGNCGPNGGSNVKWSLSDNGTLTITGKGEMGTWEYGYNIFGSEVKVPWHDYRDEIKKVKIGEGVTSIGGWAFANTHITSVTLPSSLKTLGRYAFAYCYDLREVNLNNGLEKMEHNIFVGDTLDYLFIPASVKDIDHGMFTDIDIQNLEFGDSDSGYKVIDGSIFQNNGKKLIYAPTDQTGTYIVPDTVQEIGDSVFRLTRYTEVILPDGLQKIGEQAFAYMPIEHIDLPSTLKEIGDHAFTGTHLKHIDIPSSVTELGIYCFSDNSKLESAVVGCSLDTSERGLFCGDSMLKSVTLNADATSIPRGTFAECGLESITLPASVKEIGDLAFAYCESLKAITLRDGLTSIGEGAFYNTAITEVIVPASIIHIGPNAFPASANVTMPGSTLIKLSDNSFVSNSKVAQIELKVTYGQTEARKMLSMINTFRKPANAWYYNSSNKKVYSKNLEALKYDYDLEKLAMQRAAELAMDFKHTSPDGTDSFYLNSNGLGLVGECIAFGPSSASGAFDKWKETDNSYSGQGHRRMMLSEDANCIGIGHVVYNGRHYWVQEFGYRGKINTTKTQAKDTGSTVTMTVGGQCFWNDPISISPASILVDVNGKASLPKAVESTFAKEDNVTFVGNSLNATWKSTNNKIAKIENGKVVGVSKGQTTLTCSLLGRTYKAVVIVGKLDTPKLTSVSNISTGVKVKWEKVSGTSKYKVLRKTGSQNWKSLGICGTTEFIDKTAKNGVTYYYTVYAVTADGKYRASDYDKTGLLKTFLTRPVVNSLQSKNAGSLTVKWTKNSSSGGYQIQYATDSMFSKNVNTMTVAGGSKVGKTITGLQKGKKYYVRMRCYKKVSGRNYYSSWSPAKQGTVKK